MFCLHYTSSSSCSSRNKLGRPRQKSLRLRRFKSDPDEIWPEYSSFKYASTDAVGIFNLTSKYQDGGLDVISRK